MSLHHGAGVAALLAAFTDQERSVGFSQQQLLCLRPVHVPHKPALLIVVRQFLILLANEVSPVGFSMLTFSDERPTLTQV